MKNSDINKIYSQLFGIPNSKQYKSRFTKQNYIHSKLDLSNIEYLSVFHETPIENLSSIQTNGLISPINSASWFFVTTTIEGAEAYRQNNKEHVILQFDIPKNKIDEYLWIDYALEHVSDIYGIQIALRNRIPPSYLETIHYK